MSSKHELGMENKQPINSKSSNGAILTKAATKATNRAQTPTPPPNGDGECILGQSPTISPKTQYSHLNPPEIRKAGGPFGKYTFSADVMGWASMGALATSDQARTRGASVMPEPETEERMKDLASGLMRKGGLKANTKVDVARK